MHRANLFEADLTGTNLTGADLFRADMRLAGLSRTNLTGADLSGADLFRADMRWANLTRADLSGADLFRADMRWANLTRADLSGANLSGTKLTEANLSDTVLDPSRAPNGDAEGFEIIRDRNNTEWCVGYRTQESPYMGAPMYIPGELRTAPWFSTSDDPCHPGIYVVPSVDMSETDKPLVKVIFRPEECHKTWGQWRVRWLIVWEEVTNESI